MQQNENKKKNSVADSPFYAQEKEKLFDSYYVKSWNIFTGLFEVV